METYRLTRDIPVDDGIDVLVAGGGPAGTAAAVCAARLGAKVLLAEATGCLGGMGTAGLVATFGPISDGKRMLVGGFMRELVETMYGRGLLGPHVVRDFLERQLNRWVPFKPEGLKRMLDELVQNAGVDMRFFTRVIDADAGERGINGVIISNIEGYRYIRAKTFIDATGDAALSSLAGAECKVMLRDIDTVAPSTLCSLFAGIDWDDPSLWRGLARHRQGQGVLQEAAAAGDRGRPLHAGGPLHAGHEQDRRALGRAERRARVQSQRARLPLAVGRNDVRPQARGGIRRVLPQVRAGLREHRAAHHGARDGRARLAPDRRRVRAHHGGFFVGASVPRSDRGLQPADGRASDRYDGEGISAVPEGLRGHHGLGEGDSIGVPYSILVPKGWSNLWVAGRCHSSDTKVHGSIRAQSAAYMMGQAAATAAVQSIRTGQPACDLDTRTGGNAARNGAYLPQQTLSKTIIHAGGLIPADASNERSIAPYGQPCHCPASMRGA